MNEWYILLHIYVITDLEYGGCTGLTRKITAEKILH